VQKNNYSLRNKLYFCTKLIEEKEKKEKNVVVKDISFYIGQNLSNALYRTKLNEILKNVKIINKNIKEIKIENMQTLLENIDSGRTKTSHPNKNFHLLNSNNSKELPKFRINKIINNSDQLNPNLKNKLLHNKDNPYFKHVNKIRINKSYNRIHIPKNTNIFSVKTMSVNQPSLMQSIQASNCLIKKIKNKSRNNNYYPYDLKGKSIYSIKELNSENLTHNSLLFNNNHMKDITQQSFKYEKHYGTSNCCPQCLSMELKGKLMAKLRQKKIENEEQNRTLATYRDLNSNMYNSLCGRSRNHIFEKNIVNNNSEKNIHLDTNQKCDDSCPSLAYKTFYSHKKIIESYFKNK
jgi:hypothetical protein